MKRFSILFSRWILFVVAVAPVWSAPGDLDFSFNAGSSLDGFVFAVAARTDGKVVIAGNFQTVRGAARTGIAVLNADGSADVSFKPPRGDNPLITRITWTPDGKLMISGSRIDPVTGYSIAPELKRLNADGSLDTTFVPVSPLGVHIQAMAVQSDGKVIVAGPFYLASGSKRQHIARLNTDGSLDTSFDADSLFDGDIYDVEIQGADKVLVGGLFTGFLKRLNSDGAEDASFLGTNKLDSSVADISIDRSGKILLAGSFTAFDSQRRSRVARLFADGTLDLNFAASLSVDNTVQAIREAPDGKVVIGGYFMQVDGAARVGLARLGTDGRLDAAFVPPPAAAGSYAPVSGLDFDGEARLLAAGSFEWLDGNVRLARLNNNGDADASFQPRDSIASATSIVSAIALQSDFKPLVAISKKNFEGSMIQRMNLDGSIDNSFTPISMPGETDVIYVQRDGKILAASRNWTGSFAGEFKRFNADGTIDTTFNVTSPPSEPINAMIQMPNDDIAIVGAFDSLGYVNGRPRQTARFDANGSISTNYMEMYLGLGIGGPARALALDAAGRVLIGFSNGSCSCTHPTTLARLRKDGRSDTAFDATAVEPQYYSALLVQPDGKILAGGFRIWQRAQNITHNGIIRFNPDGTVDSSFRSGLTNDADVNAIGLETSGKIVVNDRGRVTRLNANGSIDTTFGITSATGQSPPILAMILQSDGNILAAGQFDSINLQARARIVRLFGTTIPIPLVREVDNDGITLRWSNPAFRLQSTPSLDLPFEDVPSAMFSWQRSLDLGQSYFRLKAN